MGLVNPPEVLPGILRALYRLYVAEGPAFEATAETAIALLAPPTVVNDGRDPARRAEFSFREAVSLGMLTEVAPPKKPVKESPAYRLTLPAPAPDADDSEVDSVFVRELRRLVMAPENNEPLFGDDDDSEEGAERERHEKLATTRAREFTRVQAWLLTRSPANPASWADPEPTRNVQQLQDQYDGRDLVVNGSRWTSFRRWSMFLGFSRERGSGNRLSLVSDPTNAIRDEIPAVTDGGSEMPVVDLRARLAEVLPVLDGGSYRDAVLHHIGHGNGSHLLSQTLEFALMRLERDGVLKLTSRADFAGGTVTVDGKPYTHAVVKDA